MSGGEWDIGGLGVGAYEQMVADAHAKAEGRAAAMREVGAAQARKEAAGAGAELRGGKALPTAEAMCAAREDMRQYVSGSVGQPPHNGAAGERTFTRAEVRTAIKAYMAATWRVADNTERTRAVEQTVSELLGMFERME